MMIGISHGEFRSPVGTTGYTLSPIKKTPPPLTVEELGTLLLPFLFERKKFSLS